MPKYTPLRESFNGQAEQMDAALRAYQRRYAGRIGAAPFHRFFATNRDVKLPAANPPLSRMLAQRGGRGGETRLKTYLTLIWLAEERQRNGRDTWEVDLPRSEVARLIGAFGDDTKDDETNRRRNIRARDRMDRAFKWLEDSGFVERTRYTSRVRLLDDRGSGAEYLQPGSKANELSTPWPSEYKYFKIPASFWTSGLIGLMTADELGSYLALLSNLDGGPFAYRSAPDPSPQWFTAEQWREQFHLSREMRYSGFRKLEERGIIRVKREPVHITKDPDHMRDVYFLQTEYDGRVKPPTEADLRILKAATRDTS